MSTSYKDSKHKWTYIWIAIKHFTTPSKVYDICHNGTSESKNRAILHDLAKYGIIHHKHNSDSRSHHHHHHKRDDSNNRHVINTNNDRHYRSEEFTKH